MFGNAVRSIISLDAGVINCSIEGDMMKINPLKQGKVALYAETIEGKLIEGSYLLIDVAKDLTFTVKSVDKIPTAYKYPVSFKFESIDKSGIKFYYEGIENNITTDQMVNGPMDSFEYVLDESTQKKILTIYNNSGLLDRYIVTKKETELEVQTIGYPISLAKYVNVFGDMTDITSAIVYNEENLEAKVSFSSDKVRIDFIAPGVYMIAMMNGENIKELYEIDVIEFQGYFGVQFKVLK